MGKIFYMMGKSATGKDTIYRSLLNDHELGLRYIVPYTTRPIRDGEEDGREYHFCDEGKVQELIEAGRVIELREYKTVYGPWKYLTVDDGQIDLCAYSYLAIGTLESYLRVRDYFGKEKVVPIYIKVEDGERLIRAIARERQQAETKYEEMCRRFLTDAADFSEEKLSAAGIKQQFVNRDLADTISQIRRYICEIAG